MSVKQHIARWIVTSINKHFDDRKETNYLHIDGSVRTTNKESNFTEIKIDGPYMVEMSRNCFNLIVEVNVYAQAQCSVSDMYNLLKMLGIIQKAFVRCIPVYKYGNGLEDDGTFVGSLILLQEFRQRLVESHFGQTKPSENIKQGQIEGHYEMYLNMDNSY